MEGAGNIMEGTENTREGAGDTREEAEDTREGPESPGGSGEHQGRGRATRARSGRPRGPQGRSYPRRTALRRSRSALLGLPRDSFSGSLGTWGSCWFVCLLCFAWSLGRFLGNLAKAPREHRGASPAPLPGDAPLRNHVRGPATGGCCPQSPPGAIWAEIPRASPTAARRHACARPRTADMMD